ncbi:hypothetical protein [Acutalibacter sp. JLR.KK004]|uniref:hypothetical protein n=1 Tax=Acutalibacter sp. JLR.KK004 TaxID=3112622 RepID=UPI002FF108FD
MTKMDEKTAIIKASPLGKDLLDALWNKQPHDILDVSLAIVTLKEHLVKDLSPGDLKYLYPVYFDAARVLIAECIAEFFQTGHIFIRALRPFAHEVWVARNQADNHNAEGRFPASAGTAPCEEAYPRFVPEARRKGLG